jgi:hypothetical protein
MNAVHARTRSVIAMLAIGTILAMACMFAGIAQGSDGIPVKLTNDTSSNVVVTVIDLNLNPEQVLISNETIYGFASLSIRVSPDASGFGHIRWTATSGDIRSRTCGHKETDQLSADSVVHVSANNSCDAK